MHEKILTRLNLTLKSQLEMLKLDFGKFFETFEYQGFIILEDEKCPEFLDPVIIESKKNIWN